MILISNHLLRLDEFKKLNDVTIRINIAHVTDINELQKYMNINRDIMIDFPTGRTKPPKPKWSFDEIIKMLHLLEWKNVKYFAASNIEYIEDVKNILNCLPTDVSFIPKIETKVGILNLENILTETNINYIMLDGEDLYTDVKHNNVKYLDLLDKVKNICIKCNVNLLNLYGVIFSDEQ